MTELVEVVGGQMRVTSKVVADTFGKIHRNILRDIESLDCSEEFRTLNFEHTTYVTRQNKVMPCVTMTKNGFYFLAMGFTGPKAAEWKELFINAFDRLETSLINDKKSVMQSLSEAISQMESDKDLASLHGKALARWKNVRKQHVENVRLAHERAQTVLNFG